MSPELLALMTTDQVEAIASELVSCLSRFLEMPPATDTKARAEFPGSADFEFELAKEDGQIKSSDANTFLSFDLNEHSVAKKFLKAMYAEELTDDEVRELNAFVALVTNRITQSYSLRLREIIRKVVLPGSQEESIPLDEITVKDIELTDYSAVCADDRHLMKYVKSPSAHLNMKAISDYIMSESNRLNIDEDGNDVPLESAISSFQIAHGAIQQKHPLFAGVLDVEKGDRYIWDVAIAFFVDYSVSDVYLTQNRGM